MTPKKLLVWVLFASLIYHGGGFFKTHTSSDVIFYKRFVKAVEQGDTLVVNAISTNEIAGKSNEVKDYGIRYLQGSAPVFGYFDIKSRRLSPDGNVSYINADRVFRANPLGYSTLWGKLEYRMPQSVQLVRNDDTWKVIRFDAIP